MKKRYTRKQLYDNGPQRTFSGEHLRTISFPLGGIGTGSVGLSGRGGLVDWEIFNRPNKGSVMPRTFPLIWARAEGKEPVCRVLEAPALPPHEHRGGGDPFMSGEGFPHMDACTFRGEYPFAWVDFTCRKLPVAVTLEAYNPFIPSNPDDSGFPAAILRYTVTNTTKSPVDVTLAWSMRNMVGTIGDAERDPILAKGLEFGFGQNVNEEVRKGGLRGLLFRSDKWPKNHPRYGTMALLTPNRRVTILKHWKREGWFAAAHDFWDSFAPSGRFPKRELGPTGEGQTDDGAVGVRETLASGESKDIVFYVTWHFPHFEKYWGEVPCCASCKDQKGTGRATWKNYYATQFADALDVAVQYHKRSRELYEKTRLFHAALFASTLPPHVIDAVSSQMSTLKTTTCLRLSDGTFYGWEGCSPASGCCEGSCTHVWNYQQTLPFLFPSLERSMREADYKYNLREDGGMAFRLGLPLGTPPNDFHACVDGQLGGVIKTYRDWKISGDHAWLRKWWPRVKRSLEYAWVQWDSNRDGVIDGIQHNTYDIEFQGANPLSAAFYLGALTAGAAMAEAVGDTKSAATYRSLAEKGRAWVEKHLFNGEYYIQKHDAKKAPVYQFGEGCLSDQLLGQQLASLAGLGYVLDKGQVRSALASVFAYNWRADLSEHANAQRVYALNDEAGLLMCTWPKGGRPAVPVVYCDEVWTGFEYQVATHLILEGMVRKGLTIVKAARDRHDGAKRDPWNEFECGNHYARAMSAYGLLLALSGFTYDMPNRSIGFAPRIHKNHFLCFWALDGAWGTLVQQKSKAIVTVLHGSLEIARLVLPALGGKRVQVASTAGRIHARAGADGRLDLPDAIRLNAGDAMTVSA